MTLYQKIINHINQEIDSSVLLPGSKVPSTNELREKFKVSHITVLRAFKDLVDAGVLVRKSGIGFFVRGGNVVSEPRKFFGCIGNFVRPLRAHGTDDNLYNEINCAISNELCIKHLNSLSNYSTLSLNHSPIADSDLECICSEMVLASSMVDGFLVDNRIPDKLLKKVIEKTAKPMVIVNRTSSLAVGTVTPPNWQGTQDLLGLAIKMGYQSFVLCLSGVQDPNESAREKAFYDFVRYSKIENEQVYCVPDMNINDFSLTQAHVLDIVLQRKSLQGKCLFFCVNDYCANLILKIKADRKIELGEKFGVAGGNGMDISRQPNVTVTTMISNANQLGITAVQLLCDMLKFPDLNKQVNKETEVKLQIGDSM